MDIPKKYVGLIFYSLYKNLYHPLMSEQELDWMPVRRRYC